MPSPICPEFLLASCAQLERSGHTSWPQSSGSSPSRGAAGDRDPPALCLLCREQTALDFTADNKEFVWFLPLGPGRSPLKPLGFFCYSQRVPLITPDSVLTRWLRWTRR